MRIESLNKFHDAMNLMLSAQDRLLALSDHFDATGNERVSYKLADIANNVQTSYDLVVAAANEAVGASADDAQQATANMMLAVLAVVK